MKFRKARGSFTSFANKFVYRGIAAGRARLVSVRRSSTDATLCFLYIVPPFFCAGREIGGIGMYKYLTTLLAEETILRRNELVLSARPPEAFQGTVYSAEEKVPRG